MYGKLFEQIFDSSIADDYLTRFVFEDFIILADANGIVDMTPESMSRRTNVPLEIIRKAIARLEQTDPRSRTPDHDGRRILRLDEHRDWGWQIVNHAKYRGMKSDEDRRTYMREYMADRRKQESLQKLTEANSASASVKSGYSESGGEEGDARGRRMPSDGWPQDHVLATAAKPTVAVARDAALAYYDTRAAVGWLKGKDARTPTARTQAELEADLRSWGRSTWPSMQAEREGKQKGRRDVVCRT